MTDLFISYAREDRPQADRLATALQKLGFSVWWDIDSLRLGASFAREIEQAVSGAKAVLVLWSRHSQSSEWVEAEATLAWKQKKLCSVIVEKGTEVPFPFNTRHALRLTSWNGGVDSPELQRLKRDIEAIAGASQAVTDVSGRAVAPASAVSKPDLAFSGSGHKPLSTYRDRLRAGEDGPEMVVIPAGSFRMGSPTDEEGRFDDEGPRHLVEIPQPFALGKTLVTFASYDFYAEVTGHEKPDDSSWGRGNRPVINVNWEEAVAYAAWLSEQTGKRYRLLSEAEWEYACRAGTQTRWSFGDEESDLNRYAWHSGNSGDKTHPVGEKEPNPWGLQDMHGNVWEWTQDCWHANYRSVPTDGSAWGEAVGGDCGRRVLRGGSWLNFPEKLRSANRDRAYADYRDTNIGFRLAQDL